MGRKTCTVDDQGRGTIPEPLREELDIGPGVRVTVDTFGDGVLVKRSPSAEELADAYERNAERAERIDELWKHASVEANREL